MQLESQLNFLLNIDIIGDRQRNKFINECRERPERFEERIKRQKLLTFTTEAGKKRITSKDGKILAACFVRGLFGSILDLTIKKRIDIREVLAYPLTPLPLSLCHVDGSLLHSPKAALLHHLESKIVSSPPSSVDVTIVDAMFFMHLQVNLPGSFDEVARCFLAQLTKFQRKVIHFVSVKWISPSIKDDAREGRSEVTSSYCIKGPGQKRRNNWQETLKNTIFKKALIAFLLTSGKKTHLQRC